MTNEVSTIVLYDKWHKDNYGEVYKQVRFDAKQDLCEASNYKLADKSAGLADFADNTFRVGYKKAFMIISDKLCAKLEEADVIVNEYLAVAEEMRAEIESCIAQDAQAIIHAEQAYNDVMQESKDEYTELFYDPETKKSVSLYSERIHKEAAAKAREDTWERENCYLWKD